MAREGNEEGTSDIKPKFTGGRAAGGCGKYGGWSDDGLVRFNELIALVKKDRSDHETWDRGYMKKKERAALEEIQVSGNKRKRRPEPQQQRIVAIHDCLFSDDDST
jgi:hypothetical protein